MNLVIGTDGSPYAIAALRAATRLVPESALTVVAVAQQPVTYVDCAPYPAMPLDGLTYQRLYDEARQAAEAALAQAKDLLEGCGATARYELRWGDPAEEILHLAAERRADAIVLGSHGRGALARLFLGSVSEAVLHRWAGVTMIVRAPGVSPEAQAERAAAPRFRTVRDAMTPAPTCIAATATLTEAAARMRDAHVGFLPVLDGTRLAGVVTDRDLVVRALSRGDDPAKTPAEAVMSGPAVTIAPEAACDEAVRQMERRHIRRLVVSERGALVGVVSLSDLAAWRPGEAGSAIVEIVRPQAESPRPDSP